MQRMTTWLATACLLLLGGRAFGQPFKAEEALNKQLELIEKVTPQVETYDLPRLIFLRAATQRAKDSLLDDKRGPLHRETANQFYNLVIGYRYSKSFFDQIKSDDTADSFDELFAIANRVADAYGLDDSTKTQITASSFTQMHKLVLQLLQMDIPDDLRTQLEAMKEPLGHVIATAALGDRFKTFKAAIPVCKQLHTLYPLFLKVRPGEPAYNVILEIQGLNDTYVDYAQIEEELNKH